ncbi:Rne/Rng family ribonuclease [Alkalihalophilus pseudofirmus]|uniref:Rne/Rng family ribonuclease n=1 Tax=Alkalihalophilus pseudofirmus TaxID=79885 RepID=UPI00259BDC07|nr:Rne/Rng family ribonuclease [Alkalihalophilus pseudofirmus]WEG16088.1 Rne/Rng family ribonuclease [Alkalihalophilus pseudofirmus]
MNRKIYFNTATRERRAAIVENGQVVELLVERPAENRIVGNVYIGRVVNVLPGMQAAFVDIGREKNGFLYRDDLLSFHLSEEAEDVKKQRNITEFVTKGQELLVQVTKEGFGQKGPRLSGVVSMPGKYTVYMPEGGYVGVSRRMGTEEERERLRRIGEDLLKENEGMIIRTVCEDAKPEVIEQDLHFLRTSWESVWQEVKEKRAPALIHQGSSLIEKMMLDFSLNQIDEIVIDDADDYQTLKALLAPYSDVHEKVRLYHDKENIFSVFGIDKELDKALRRQIWLKNGAYLIVDQTEALTVIDVNTGKFTGKTDLQDTVRKTNLEAAKEIARQLRLRDTSGIIIIDFIDMKREEDREYVLEAFKRGLKQDRTKTNVVGLTGLGLVEMTRKKVRQSLQASLSKACPTCKEQGSVLSDEAQAYKIERLIWEYRGMDHEAILIELPSAVSAVLAGPKGELLKQLEEATGFRILLMPNKHMPEEAFAIRFMGDLEEAASQLERLKQKKG